MKKRLKKAGITVLALSTISVGTAFANQDAAGKLKTWYDGVFGESTKEIKSELISYAKSKIPGLEQEVEKLINTTNQRITNAAAIETERADGRIDAYKEEYLNELSIKKDQLVGVDENEGIVPQEFNGFVEAKKNEINSYIDEHTDRLLAELSE